MEHFVTLKAAELVVLCEKGEGGGELYDVKSVRYEDWRTKKWTPKPSRLAHAPTQACSSLAAHLELIKPIVDLRSNAATSAH